VGTIDNATDEQTAIARPIEEHQMPPNFVDNVGLICG
jgi:hypothetical protein